LLTESSVAKSGSPSAAARTWPEWRALAPVARGRILKKAAELLRARADEIAHIAPPPARAIAAPAWAVVIVGARRLHRGNTAGVGGMLKGAMVVGLMALVVGRLG